MTTFALLLLAASTNSGKLPPRPKPLKVFILAGQSNMQGHANISTLDSLSSNPKTAPLLRMIRNSDGSAKVCKDVWISSVGCAGDGYSQVIEQTGRLTIGFGASPHEIGPELTLGLRLEKEFKEPILLIKTSWGGRNLHTDFRPPSAGKENPSEYKISQWVKRGLNVESETQKMQSEGGVFYRFMIDHIHHVLADIRRVDPDYDPKQGYQLSGFVWFQGFNDMIDDWTYHDRMSPNGYAEYSTLLADLIRDVRRECSAPRMPVVIGVMGIGGAKEDQHPPQANFRIAQSRVADMPEFKGNVAAVHTSIFWDDDLDSLQTRRERMNQELDKEMKANPSMSKEEKDRLRQAKFDATFTPDEQQKLLGVSNGGYHYLGAAKIMAPIGNAFAESLIDMLKKRH